MPKKPARNDAAPSPAPAPFAAPQAMPKLHEQALAALRERLGEPLYARLKRRAMIGCAHTEETYGGLCLAALAVGAMSYPDQKEAALTQAVTLLAAQLGLDPAKMQDAVAEPAALAADVTTVADSAPPAAESTPLPSAGDAY